MWFVVFVGFLSVVPTDTKPPSPVSECNEFFLNKRPPWVPDVLEGGEILDQDRYKVICQTFKDKRRFFTLYDTENRIPNFSAYKYGGGGGDTPRRQGWYTEPKLEGSGMWDGTYRNQADPNDYMNSGPYNRGHLFPFSHGFTEDDQLSTNTLTNIVPQVKAFNGGSWANVESCTKCVLDQLCINKNRNKEGFVVVGAWPSNTRQLNDRVNVPDVLWSAFCCYSSTKDKWLASAYWGENKEDPPKYLRTSTLDDLRRVIAGLVVFEKSNCPLFTTVEEYYPELKASCNCPRPYAIETDYPNTIQQLPEQPQLLPRQPGQRLPDFSLDPSPHQPLPAQPNGERLPGRPSEDSKNNQKYQQERKPLKLMLDPEPFQPN